MLKTLSASLLCTTLLSVTGYGAAYAETMPSQEKMWEIIQQQQAEIHALKQRLQTNEEKIEATSDMAEQAATTASNYNSDSAPGWWQNTSLGGYGEMHYNNSLSGDGDDEIDFHRFVLFVNHEFSDSIRLFTEVEVEHSIAGDGENGEIELEQAYIEFDLNEFHQAKAGLFLVPVGIMNERHEPTTFFGVERNPVEKNVIPTTWWEGGLAFNGELGNGFGYDLALHSGLNVETTGSKAFKVRDGRQKVSEADADKGAVTGRIRWNGIPGVSLASSMQYQQDVTQDNSVESVDATLFEAHADILKNGWGLRALYARWDMDGTEPEALGTDEQYGWYVEPSYRFDTPVGMMGLFARYNEYDNAAGSNIDSKYQQTDLGINYWPHSNVVLKADVALVDEPTGTSDEILNLGVGFHF